MNLIEQIFPGILRRLNSPVLLALLLAGCQAKKDDHPQNSDKPRRFELLSADQTGVTFVNHLQERPDLNIFTYLYIYNGAGVAAGDLNGDGLPDLYFTSNQEKSKLYLNRGNFKFDDITEEAGVGGPYGWTTGVTMADVNGDGLLDIYVSRVGSHPGLQGKNLLYINQGTRRPGRAGVRGGR